MEGLVFHIQRFSVDDGGGIRTCVFLKGCPLRCAWCHNAEGLSHSAEIALHAQLCIGCGACCSACQRGALTAEGASVFLAREKCTACGACAAVCATGALSAVGKKLTVGEVMAVVRRDRIFYGASGGLTVSGGEPMAQADFTVALCEAAKAEKISTAVETSGYGKREDYARLLPFCDLFLFDCKASSEDHARLVGIEDRRILENLDFLSRSGARILLRCPIVLGANLSEAFIEKIIALAKKYASVEAVQLMPYHKTGSEKGPSLGRTAQTVFHTPKKEMLLEIARKIEEKSGKRTFFW